MTLLTTHLNLFSIKYTMVSRRKILSRSRDDLNLDSTYQQQGEEDDVWHQKEKLFKVSYAWFAFSFNKNESKESTTLPN